MWKAINKYGWDSIVTDWLDTKIPDLKTACEKERFWINEYKSNNSEYGYNLANGGQGGATTKYNHQEIIQYWYEGFNVTDIVNKFNCSSNTVYRILDEYNIPSSERRSRQNQKNGKTIYKYDYDKITEDWLSGMSSHAICEKYGCSRGTVRLALNKNNISLEERDKRRQEESIKSMRRHYGYND